MVKELLIYFIIVAVILAPIWVPLIIILRHKGERWPPAMD